METIIENKANHIEKITEESKLEFPSKKEKLSLHIGS